MSTEHKGERVGSTAIAAPPAKLDVETLDREAFDPTHPFSISDARDYAYAIAFSRKPGSEFESHLATCELCNDRVAIIRRTDPGLTGELAEQVRTVIQAAQDPKFERTLQGKARAALAAAFASLKAS